ncbi:MAG: hypothetical protein K2K75_04125 [Muribaculaceae bacterium]|nr:hypothetical protein [Muribaculaceae bacterium]
MLKKLIASCFIATAAFSAVADDGTFVFSYAGDDYGYWGKGKAEIYDAAIRIQDPSLVGKKIIALRAVLNAYEDIEDTSIWLSKELTLEKVGSVKVTVPDVCSFDVTPEKISLPGSDDSYGQLSATLSEPYVITEEGIYVGYSLTVPAAEKGKPLSNKQQNPLLLSSCSNPNSLYLRASKDFLKWMAYNSKLNAAAMIYVTLEGEIPEYSVGLTSLASAYAPVDKEFNIHAVITTPGAKDVSSIGYTYTIGGNSFDRTLEFDTPIASDFINSTSVDLPISPVAELGEYSLDLTINKVNGMDNANSKSSASCELTVLPFVPKHRPMLEEFTGTWCGWCTRGFIALEKLNELYGDDVVLAAYHDGDSMQASGFPVDDVESLGFPSSMLNRGPAMDPYYANSNIDFGMKDAVKASIDTTVPADIQVRALWGDEDKTVIKIQSTATFFVDKQDAGYKVGYLLINNGLRGSGTGWIQSNYYSSQAGQYDGTDLEILTTWPSKVPGLVFNDVVVDTEGMMGVDGAVPSDIVYNQPYSSEFSYDIASNDVIQDKDSLYVAAFIINPNGTILNSNKAKVDGFAAVNSFDANVEEVSVEYFNLSGCRVAYPDQGVFVKVSKMSDGSRRTSKIILP